MLFLDSNLKIQKNRIIYDVNEPVKQPQNKFDHHDIPAKDLNIFENPELVLEFSISSILSLKLPSMPSAQSLKITSSSLSIIDFTSTPM